MELTNEFTFSDGGPVTCLGLVRGCRADNESGLFELIEVWTCTRASGHNREVHYIRLKPYRKRKAQTFLSSAQRARGPAAVLAIPGLLVGGPFESLQILSRIWGGRVKNDNDGQKDGYTVASDVFTAMDTQKNCTDRDLRQRFKQYQREFYSTASDSAEDDLPEEDGLF